MEKRNRELEENEEELEIEVVEKQTKIDTDSTLYLDTVNRHMLDFDQQIIWYLSYTHYKLISVQAHYQI